jgi:uncharacterized protein (UPF0333 family)
MKMKNLKNYFFRGSISLPFIIVLLFVILVGFFVVRTFTNQSSAAPLSADGRVDVEKPNKQMTLNKVFLFPLKDENGEVVEKLRYEILTAETLNQIIV